MPVPIQIITVPETGQRQAPTPRSWESYFHCSQDQDVHEALRYIRRILTERWSGLRSNAPLNMMMVARIQHGKPECVRLWEILRTLENLPNRDIVVRNQIGRTPALHLHGMTVLELAASAQTRGLHVVLHPPGDGGNPADLDIEHMRIEVKCSAGSEDDGRWALLSCDVSQQLEDMGLRLNDFTISLDNKSVSSSAVDHLVQAARQCRFFAGERVYVEDMALVSWTPNRGSFSARERDKPLSRLVVNEVKRKRAQLCGHSGPRIVLVRVGNLDLRHPLEELDQLADELLHAMRGWPEVSACVVLADVFLPAAGARRICRRRYLAWLGASDAGTARLVSMFSNPTAKYAIAETERESLMEACIGGP